MALDCIMMSKIDMTRKADLRTSSHDFTVGQMVMVSSTAVPLVTPTIVSLSHSVVAPASSFKIILRSFISEKAPSSRREAGSPVFTQITRVVQPRHIVRCPRAG